MIRHYLPKFLIKEQRLVISIFCLVFALVLPVTAQAQKKTSPTSTKLKPGKNIPKPQKNPPSKTPPKQPKAPSDFNPSGKLTFEEFNPYAKTKDPSPVVGVGGRVLKKDHYAEKGVFISTDDFSDVIVTYSSRSNMYIGTERKEKQLSFPPVAHFGIDNIYVFFVDPVIKTSKSKSPSDHPAYASDVSFELIGLGASVEVVWYDFNKKDPSTPKIAGRRTVAAPLPERPVKIVIPGKIIGLSIEPIKLCYACNYGIDNLEFGSTGLGTSGVELLTLEELLKLFPNLDEERAREVIGSLNATMERAEINTCDRKVAFLSQSATETFDFQNTRKEFTAMEEVNTDEYFENNYEQGIETGENVLGNKYPGDGKLFRGRGWLHLTGRWNYEAATAYLKKIGFKKNGQYVDLASNPDLVAQDLEINAAVSAWHWKILRKANAAADARDIRRITIRVNGGENGLETRTDYYNNGQLKLCSRRME